MTFPLQETFLKNIKLKVVGENQGPLEYIIFRVPKIFEVSFIRIMAKVRI